MTENLGDDRRAELVGRSSRWRARSRAWRRTAGRSPMRRWRAATSATQMERSIESVAQLARRADELARRVSADAEEGGAAVAALDPGHRPAARGDVAVVVGDEGDGQAHQRHQLDRRHHQPDRRAHQPAVAERLDRSGARRRRRPRLRGGGRGDSQPRRSLGQGHRRHRGDHQGPAGRGAGRGHAHPTEGLRVADDSNAIAEDRRGRAAQDPVGHHRDGRPRRRRSRARPTSSATAGKAVARAVAATAEQARLVADGHRASRPIGRDASCRAPAQMRKVAQEVTKAVTEQGRASRDIMKAAQSDRAAVASRSARRPRSRRQRPTS